VGSNQQNLANNFSTRMKRKETTTTNEEPEFNKPLQRAPPAIDDATLKLMDDLPPVRTVPSIFC
jgi:hypothetical protein